jgi:hypothetical protein
MAHTTDGELDYEAYARGARRRFVITVGAVVAVLIGCLYVPWGLVAARVLASGVAEVISCVSALLLIGAWRGLLMKLADPADAPPGTDRGQHTLRLLLVCGGVLGTVLLFAVGAWLAGWVGGMGLGWGVLLDFMLVMAAGSALLRRAIREI